MDLARFEVIVRSLATTPSRRAVLRALAGLSVASGFAPLLRLTEADARNRGRKKKNRKRKKRKPNACPANQELCSAGDFTECCSKAVNPTSGNPFEICTDCGCCDYGFANCCPGRSAAVCCKEGDKCCYTENFEPHCCGSGAVCCGTGCCDQGEACCQTTGANPFHYCCAQGLICKPSGGATCQ